MINIKFNQSVNINKFFEHRKIYKIHQAKIDITNKKVT